MPRPRSAMRKIKEVLRLTFAEGLSRRRVGAAVGLPTTTVFDYVRRAARAGLGWPLPDELDDSALERRLLKMAERPSSRPEPDWERVHRELRRKGVTLQLLWLEHKEQHPNGHQYSQFCRRYRLWQRQLDVVMRQEHRAGEKCFVDYAGQTVPIIDAQTGELMMAAEIFVGVLGASNFTYAEAFPSQELPHWIAGHVHAFSFFGGSTQIVVPDNLRSGVTRAHRYEPELNRSYAEMAAHYGCVIIPARPRRPRDKAKVEQGVLLVERWILARLRDRTFFSLAELNAAIRELLVGLNHKPFKKMAGSRQSLFAELERPALRPLPQRPYEYATWRVARVNIDYHVEVDRHYYSVPYQLVGAQVDVRLTAHTVELLHRGRRVASHLHSDQRGRHTTEGAHMPESHRRHLEWTPSRIVRWAAETGPQTALLVGGVMESRPHPEQGFRSCLGIMRLGTRYGAARLEAASTRALAIKAFSYRSVESILKTGLDREPLPTAPAERALREHENLRGPRYYH